MKGMNKREWYISNDYKYNNNQVIYAFKRK